MDSVLRVRLTGILFEHRRESPEGRQNIYAAQISQLQALLISKMA